jgi:hypothetical protein
MLLQPSIQQQFNFFMRASADTDLVAHEMHEKET